MGSPPPPEFGTHPDPCISDVCCYSQPRFKEFYGKIVPLIEGGSHNHGSLPHAEREYLWPDESCVKVGGFTR